VESSNQRGLRRFVSAFGDPVIFSLCEHWQVGAASPVAVATNPIRTLLLAGAYDPITPPEWGLHVANQLPNSEFISVGAASHVAFTTSCGARLASAFMRTAAADPRQACRDSMRDVTFPSATER
jgi:pimeloyl-ACP methyl ester carboxylesterase